MRRIRSEECGLKEMEIGLGLIIGFKRMYDTYVYVLVSAFLESNKQ